MDCIVPDSPHRQIPLGNRVPPSLDDAILLETRTDRTPAPFETTFGLADPGSAISIWVVVRIEDGNERASDKVVVQHPE